MTASQSIVEHPGMERTNLPARYREDGYLIVRGVLDRSRIDHLLEETERLRQQGSGYRSTTVDGDVRWLVVEGRSGRPVLRGAQNVSAVSPLFDSLRTDPDILEVLAPLIGTNLLTIVNTLFWKVPGEANTKIAYHQDAMFRKPVERFRNLQSSYVQFGIALDPHGPENGGMKIVPASHRVGDRKVMRDRSVLVSSCDETDLESFGFRQDQLVDIRLDPGDAILVHPHLVHGSPANPSKTLNRRFIVTGYMRSADSDTGVPAFRNSHPVSWTS